MPDFLTIYYAVEAGVLNKVLFPITSGKKTGLLCGALATVTYDKPDILSGALFAPSYELKDAPEGPRG